MKKIFLLALMTTGVSFNADAQSKDTSAKFTLVIHGGAGTILKSNMSPEKEKAYRDKLTEALNKGYEILSKGGTSLDAVEAVVRILEDSPLFNAGKGAVFTNEGKNEMDASIMDGKTIKAGAVGGVTTIKNPITAARAVMEKSPHVMLMGKGAEKFAKEKGLEIVDTSYFFDQYRWDQLQKIKNQEKIKLDHSDTAGFLPDTGEKKFGTVGAVAVDKHGNLAAATSTGGMTNKRFGRIGDTPVIGAGNYANNKTCAVSGTGHGEYFIRNVVAYDVSALMEYKGMPLKEAAEYVVMKKLKEMGGEGGIIAVDAKGNFAMPFNTPGMYRGFVKEGGKPEVFIYKE
jgi:beta-aspartyl-peptidase (threonine type)